MYIDHISVRISHTKTSTSDEHIVFDDRGNLQHTRPPRRITENLHVYVNL